MHSQYRGVWCTVSSCAATSGYVHVVQANASLQGWQTFSKTNVRKGTKTLYKHRAIVRVVVGA